MAASIIRFNVEKVSSYAVIVDGWETDTVQTSQKVTGLKDGGWLVTWQSEGQDGSGIGIYQQRYAADGATVGAETKVNSKTVDDQEYPGVAALSDGGWVVTWHSYNQDGDGYGIYQQRYSANGAAIGAEAKVNLTTVENQSCPSVAALKDGGWLVTWQSYNQNSSSYDTYMQRYGANGALIGSQTLVNSYSAGFQGNPVSAGLEGGGWVVVWTSNEQDGDLLGLYQRNNGGSEKKVNTSTAGEQSDPSVTALADGGWLVTWLSSKLDDTGNGIYQQRYAANGTAVGSETKVNSASEDNRDPSVTALPDGGWLVTWYSKFWYDPYIDIASIRQQRYDASGTPVGGEQTVVSSLTDSVYSPEVTALADGGWLVTWESGAHSDIYQLRFNANGVAVGTEVTAFSMDKEAGLGTTGDDLFLLESRGLSPGDSLQAGDGIDTIQLIESGILDLTLPDLLTGVEIVQGSSDSDFILADPARLTDIVTINGGAGRDQLRLTAGSYDFTSKVISGFETIVLEGTSPATFDDKATALLVRSLNQKGSVVLQGGVFSQAERQQLYNQGVRQVTDDSGVHILQPIEAQLNASTVREGAKTGTVVGTLSATDPNPGDGLSFSLYYNAGGRFKIVGNQIQVANGALLDHEQATSHTIVVQTSDHGGLASHSVFTISIGDVAAEKLTGTSASEVLKGGAGKDVFSGAGGTDQLWGGLGHDTLAGGAGRDIFVFDTKPSKSTNRDTISDFSVKDDSLWLDNTIFTKLGSSGSLAKPTLLKSGFFALDAAKDKNDYLIYNRKTGVLSYDADGSGAKVKAVEIALLKKSLALTYKDFFVI